MSAAEHYEEAFFEDDTDYESPSAGCVVEQQVQDSIRCVKYWRSRIANLEDLYLKEELRIKDVYRRLREEAEKKIAWHEYALAAYLSQTKRKSVQTITGKATVVQGREYCRRFDTTAEEKFHAWRVQYAKENNLKPDDLATFLVRTKVSIEPAIAEIKDFVHRTGEIPDGVEFDRSPDTLRIT